MTPLDSDTSEAYANRWLSARVMTRLIQPIALALIGPALLGACRDGTAPMPDRNVLPTAAAAGQVNSVRDPTSPIADAGGRLVLAVEDAAERAELQTHLRGLASAWSAGRTHLAIRELAAARRVVGLLAENGLAGAADLDAITLALDEAARTLKGPDAP